MEKHKNTCLICCNDIDILGIGSLCTHDALTCWKCAYIIQQYNKEKNCPICKNSLKFVNYLTIVQYVDATNYDPSTFSKIKFIHMDDKEMRNMNGGKVEDENQIEALYENKIVKDYIYHCTAPYCSDCDNEFRLYADYKRHLEVAHKSYICELCLKNRHCVLSDIEVFRSKADLKKHLDGKYEDSNLRHQKCPFCLNYHDDIASLKRHYRDEHRICDFCQNAGKKEKEYIFSDYKGFMLHAREFHIICGIGGCDCVFKDLTSLDMHQADIHNRTINLRIQHKDDIYEEEEEVKKIPTVTAKQYEKMNKNNKNEHFPKLNNMVKEYNQADGSGANGDKNSNSDKKKKVITQPQPQNFPNLPKEGPPKSVTIPGSQN